MYGAGDDDDDGGTSCGSVSSLSCGAVVTSSTTHHGTSRVRDLAAARRTCCSTQTRSTACSRAPCRAEIGAHQGPFARGYVPSAHRSRVSAYRPSYQPYQSTRQPALQQVGLCRSASVCLPVRLSTSTSPEIHVLKFSE